jgi:hypothetical protein
MLRLNDTETCNALKDIARWCLVFKPADRKSLSDLYDYVNSDKFERNLSTYDPDLHITTGIVPANNFLGVHTAVASDITHKKFSILEVPTIKPI